MDFDPSLLIDRLPNFEAGADTDTLARFCSFYHLPHGLDGVQQRLGQLRFNHDHIAVHRWCPAHPSGTLLIVHGYLDHHGLYGHLVRWGLANNLAVVCFDLPGHGLSNGPRAEIDSFRHYQRLLREIRRQIETWQLPTPLHLLGQSTGGAIINHHLLGLDSQQQQTLGAVILLAPLVRAARWRMVEFTHRLIGKAIKGVPRRWEPNSNDESFNNFLKQDPLQSQQINARWIGALRHWLPKFLALPPCDHPVLLIQGEQDDTVDWRYNLSVLAEKYNNLKVLRLTDARHQLANESEGIRQHYLDWLTYEQQAFHVKPS